MTQCYYTYCNCNSTMYNKVYIIISSSIRKITTAATTTATATLCVITLQYTRWQCWTLSMNSFIAWVLWQDESIWCWMKCILLIVSLLCWPTHSTITDFWTMSTLLSNWSTDIQSWRKTVTFLCFVLSHHALNKGNTLQKTPFRMDLFL